MTHTAVPRDIARDLIRPLADPRIVGWELHKGGRSQSIIATAFTLDQLGSVLSRHLDWAGTNATSFVRCVNPAGQTLSEITTRTLAATLANLDVPLTYLWSGLAQELGLGFAFLHTEPGAGAPAPLAPLAAPAAPARAGFEIS